MKTNGEISCLVSISLLLKAPPPLTFHLCFEALHFKYTLKFPPFLSFNHFCSIFLFLQKSLHLQEIPSCATIFFFKHNFLFSTESSSVPNRFSFQLGTRTVTQGVALLTESPPLTELVTLAGWGSMS